MPRIERIPKNQVQRPTLQNWPKKRTVAIQAYQRLESRKANLSVKMLNRIAQSMGKRLEIQFV